MLRIFIAVRHSSRDQFFPRFGVRVSCRHIFIVLPFILGLMALIAAPGLHAGIGPGDSGLQGGSAADTSENQPGLRAPPSSAPSSVPPGTSTLQPPAKGSGMVESAGLGCRIERMEFFSEACGTRMPYYAFIPQESKEGGASYPVLYLLHGAFDGYTAWKDHAENIICSLVSKYGIIIVTPEGRSFGWYADSRLVKDNQIETYFLDELIPDVEKRFPANGLRSIAGLSMGGHGAFTLCLRHPGFFCSVSSMSGILDITRHEGHWRLGEVFGPFKGEYIADWEEHSALKLIRQKAKYVRSLQMLITVSTNDPCSIDDNRLVHSQLKKMNVEHLYFESPGGHDWTYWTSQLPLHVAFHAWWLKSIKPPCVRPEASKKCASTPAGRESW